MIETEQLPVVRFAVFRDLDWLVHGVSTRHGGASEGHLASLNLSFAVGDDPAIVVENRRRFCGALGAAVEATVCAVQTHGTNVAVVGPAERGRGVLARGTGIPATDALVTDVPGVHLMLSFADCVPILFADPEQRAVGIAHAGWKGTVDGVVRETILSLRRVYGTRPAALRAAIGPSIGPCCYEVGPDVVDALAAAVGDPSPYLRPGKGDRPHLDLWAINRHWLLAAGVPPANLEAPGICTACSTDRFFSHRGDAGKTGRFAALIGIGLE